MIRAPSLAERTVLCEENLSFPHLTARSLSEGGACAAAGELQAEWRGSCRKGGGRHLTAMGRTEGSLVREFWGALRLKTGVCN